MEPYLYLSGLKRLSGEVKGDEIIHLGIRPYGFHAGNAVALLLYPYLLCKFIRQRGIEPTFKFIVSLNDYEQDSLDGPDTIRYPFNIYPKNSSLKHTVDERGCCDSIVEHWQPILEKCLRVLTQHYSSTIMSFVKNSELRGNTIFMNLLLHTIRFPQEQGEIMRKYSGKEVLENPMQYAGVVCPQCRKTHGKTDIMINKDVVWKCKTCAISIRRPYNQFDYWWHHKAMLCARLKIFDVDITISGADHYSEGDFLIRKAFLNLFFPEHKIPKMLFSPLILAPDGRKMSKSRNNTAFASVKTLLDLIETDKNNSIQLNHDMLILNIDEKDYSCNF